MDSKHSEKIEKFFVNLCELTNPEKKLNFAEFEKCWITAMTKLTMEDINSLFSTMFAAIDLNGDGIISFDEWKSHYVALGIPAEHTQASFAAIWTVIQMGRLQCKNLLIIILFY